MTPLYREVYYQCLDLECGHTFVACLEVIRTLAPSARPRPGIHLPIVPAAVRTANLRPQRRSGAANDTIVAANDAGGAVPTATERIAAPG